MVDDLPLLAAPERRAARRARRAPARAAGAGGLGAAGGRAASGCRPGAARWLERWARFGEQVWQRGAQRWCA